MIRKNNWKERAHEVLFGTETLAGKTFDIVLLVSILFSVVVVFLDSVAAINIKYHIFLFYAEWFFTILFTLEYILRIIISKKPFKYIFSFYGMIDFLAIIPTYLSILFVGSQYLIVIRIIRLLRIFRILKLSRYIGASGQLWQSLVNSRHKIAVFLWVIMMIVVIMGALMYIIEGPENGFRSIPESIYWAIVTMTTVGYGDISPQTALGKTLASVIMIIGYAIIAVPTGIISVEMRRVNKQKKDQKNCQHCNCPDHEDDAKFCKNCGKELF